MNISFRFRKPIGVSSARFLQHADYYITMELLSFQTDIFDVEEAKEIEKVAEFSAIFYGF